MFQRCLICTNFADGLYRLVEFVPSLAANGIQTIIFLHSVPLWEEGEIPRIDEERITRARDRLQAGLKTIPEGVEVHIEVLSGRPLDNIPKVAKRYEADVILTGMESRNFLQEKLFGSTTAELARNYTTPLLILRPQLVSTYTCEELELRVFDISAIAVSSETIGSIIELPIRSFAGELMRRSWHPVLFFPPPS
ncbi:MAG: universal stress protein [Coleofasciculus sp. A1-SPW-01]|uniref:universal stress protein n=1 Tax=Coleofasciculus sp. A1-SPW-01 TaxID=3070819 RepID=UPI0032FFA8A2